MVGTDHHPFERVLQWADGWAKAHPQARVIVQYGSAAPPQVAEAHALLDQDLLDKLLRETDVVVTHGGPATITAARSRGFLPLAVPRNPELGEHVDDHQQRFVQFLAERGLVVQVTDEAALVDALTRALTDPDAFRLPDVPEASDEPPQGVLHLGEIVADLVSARQVAQRPRRPDLTAHRWATGSDPTSDSPLTVLYIGGQGRSGSTLIERAVAQMPGAFGAGELLHLWRRGLRNDEVCGCGRPFHACPFWTEVGEVAFGGWHRLDADAVVALRYAVERNRFVPLMLLPGLDPRYDHARAAFAWLLARLYRAVAVVSGSSVIVDSSKHASYALLLRGIPGIDVRLLHVVRDSPAVAFAWSKVVTRPETAGETMPTYGPVKAAALWNTQNVVHSALARKVPHTTIRYEDFVRDPSGQLQRVAGLVEDRLPPGSQAPTAALVDHHTLRLGRTHSVAGNPMRFQTGDVAIRSDDAWQTQMTPSRRRLVAALTAPLRLRYGYLGRGR